MDTRKKNYIKARNIMRNSVMRQPHMTHVVTRKNAPLIIGVYSLFQKKTAR